MSVFTEDAGRFLNAHETKAMTGNYHERKVSVGMNPDEYVRSEYFGIKQVMHLLSQPGCIGLRVHHAKRWEDANGNPTNAGKGRLIPRVLLTGVDAEGNDMPIRADYAGLKDEGEIAQTLGDGHTCPQHCR